MNIIYFLTSSLYSYAYKQDLGSVRLPCIRRDEKSFHGSYSWFDSLLYVYPGRVSYAPSRSGVLHVKPVTGGRIMTSSPDHVVMLYFVKCYLAGNVEVSCTISLSDNSAKLVIVLLTISFSKGWVYAHFSNTISSNLAYCSLFL